jgi:hypothetical protein
MTDTHARLKSDIAPLNEHEASRTARWRRLWVLGALALALSGCTASAGEDAAPADLDDITASVDSVTAERPADATTSEAPEVHGSETTATDVEEEPGDGEVAASEVTVPDAIEGPPDAGFDASAVDAGELQGCTDDSGWPRRVLFIGNSYTAANGGLDAALTSFASGHPCSPGFAMETGRHSPGGKKLHQHYAEATTSGSALHGLLNDALGWDIVVLQDQSQVPGFPQEWSPDKVQNVDLMDDWAVLIEGVGAQVVLFMTWGRRDGDPVNSLYSTYSAMQDLLEAGYHEYAEAAQSAAEQPVRVAPVGVGWRVVHDDALSISVGPAESTARFTSLYSSDGSHPSARGTYLAAAVFFELLTGSAASPGKWHPEAIAVEDKAWLDEAASAAIALP